ncbi:hypothetical protein CEXT_525751, partial [Caerostris extrusa]
MNRESLLNGKTNIPFLLQHKNTEKTKSTILTTWSGTSQRLLSMVTEKKIAPNLNSIC